MTVRALLEELKNYSPDLETSVASVRVAEVGLQQYRKLALLPEMGDFGTYTRKIDPRLALQDAAEDAIMGESNPQVARAMRSLIEEVVK